MISTSKSPTSTGLRPATRNVTAVLGPTNTGKTHLAIERMLGHETGIIGLPLRLLAREVYSRVAERAGTDKTALVTGEEKIVPPEPRYWVCTVEAMPHETDAAFVAIDEIQLAADFERGHTFTDRILHTRGTQETLLLGSATVRDVVAGLLPGIHVVTRPRMSVLSYSGQKKITRLPERSAVVAFSANEVYAIAELIKRQRGGAAVVLGALSPRTRNKQVEIYQSGDVEFLVATDAIGMGLNLDVDHVAFASNRKFDGYQHRDLSAAELGQVAGRAGRHMRDGTFGVTGRVEPFEDALVEALETHRFAPVKVLQWRNRDLDFASTASLIQSLEHPAQHAGLAKAPPAADLVALERVSRDGEVKDMIAGAGDVRRLWDVCRLPDYRKIAPAQHASLVNEIFAFLMRDGAVPADWFSAQIKQASRTDGDIDTLSQRIAEVRTWTFIANQPDWLEDPVHWRGETRAVEDALSDALHEKLTKRFVDRRTSVLMRRLKENAEMEAHIAPDGSVTVENHHVGDLAGFRFQPDAAAEGADAKAIRAAAQKAIAKAITERAGVVASAPAEDFVLAGDGVIRWKGHALARVVAGDEVLRPRMLLLADEQLTGAPREAVEARLKRWLDHHIETLCAPLLAMQGDETLTGLARGLAFRLVENLGSIDRRTVLEDVRALDQDSRAALRRHGVRFGAYHIFTPALLKPGPSRLIAMLHAIHAGDIDLPGLSELTTLSASGRTSIAVDQGFDAELYRLVGFRIFGSRAVRIDILERLADLIRPALGWQGQSEGERPPGAVEGRRGFTVTPAMTSLLGASGDDMAVTLKGLGYKVDRISAPAGTADAPSSEPSAQPSPDSPEACETPAGLAPASEPEEAPASEPEDTAAKAADGPTPTSAEAPEDPAVIEIWSQARLGGRPRGRGRAARDADAEGAKGSRRPRRKTGQRKGKTPRAAKTAQQASRPEPAERRPARPIDPDSPFAKLAALKADLEKADE